MAFFNRSSNSRYFNWLIHHRYISDLEKHTEHIKGRMLDVGCGKKPYYNILSKQCEQYIGIEYVDSLHSLTQVDVIGDALTLPFKDTCFDSAVSFQVMEHVRDPLKFLSEIYRVLKPNSYLLLMTPFIWGEHEAPNDFFRYTRYGLTHLAQQTGFETLSVTAHTRYCETATLRFNYWIKRYGIGPLEYFFVPFLWINQFLAIVIDNIDTFFARHAGHNAYTVDTAGFTTLLHKPLQEFNNSSKTDYD